MAEEIEPKGEQRAPRLFGLMLGALFLLFMGLAAGYGVGANEGDGVKTRLALATVNLQRIELDRNRKAKQIAALTSRNCFLVGSLRHQRQLINGHVTINKPRMAKAVLRNTGSVAASFIPFAGDLADLGLTAVDVNEYRKMQRELDVLKKKSAIGISPKQLNCR